jgi:excisionase family DNA binding protein
LDVTGSDQRASYPACKKVQDIAGDVGPSEPVGLAARGEEQKTFVCERGGVTMRKLALTIKEAAEATSLSPHTIRKYIRNGSIAAYRVGRRILVPVSAIEELLGITSPQEPSSQTVAGGSL